jgi:O-acetyl-ADP-ribose deacetylase (regulator of RNase III)
MGNYNLVGYVGISILIIVIVFILFYVISCKVEGLCDDPIIPSIPGGHPYFPPIIPSRSGKVVFAIGDITHPNTLYNSPTKGKAFNVKTDAVVNAANRGVCIGAGVTGSLVKAVGGTCPWNNLKKNASGINGKVSLIGDNGTGCPNTPSCSSNSPLAVCEAVIMPTNRSVEFPYIISAAGPQSSDTTHISVCYSSIITLAEKYKIKTIVCPFISSGLYGQPSLIPDSILSAESAMSNSSVEKFIFIARPKDSNIIKVATSMLPYID